MPESFWDEELALAAGEVLETMFFTGVYGSAPPGAPETEPRLAVRLAFEGAPNGVVTLRISESAARTLAANFMAAEPDDPLPDAQLGGVVCELANMICGALLSRARTAQRFLLHSPELLSADATPPRAPNQSLDLGEGAMDLWLALETHAD